MKQRSMAVLLLAAILTLVYVVATPHTTDLAAQTARADLFKRSGFVPYWVGWYSGLSTVSYSLLTPWLLGSVGVAWLGGLTIAATGLIAPALLRDARRPNAGAVAFVVASYLDVFSGRTTFAVGAVIALAAVLAVERHRAILATILAIAATASSPVAGVLLLIVVGGLILSDPERRRISLAAAAGALICLAGIAAMSRGTVGGYQPFTVASFLIASAVCVVVAFAGVGRRVRTAALVALLAQVAVFAIHSPIGSNILRLTVLAAVPVVIAASEFARAKLAVAVALCLYGPIAQLEYDIADLVPHDTSAAFTAPLLGQLAADPGLADHRVELVDTRTHWPATYLLPTVTLARGWERQIDESLNPIFYSSRPLTAASYRAFLDRNAVAVVALPVGVPLDYGAKHEAALVKAGLPYLHEVWSDAHWQLYAVADPTSIVNEPARLAGNSDTGLTISAPAGTYQVRLRWSPYLTVNGGQVREAHDGDVLVRLNSGGTHRVHAVWKF